MRLLSETTVRTLRRSNSAFSERWRASEVELERWDLPARSGGSVWIAIVFRIGFGRFFDLVTVILFWRYKFDAGTSDRDYVPWAHDMAGRR